MKHLVILLLSFFMLQNIAFAQETIKKTGNFLPLRFVTFKFDKSNVRNGPGQDNAIKWTYLRKGYPIEVISKFEHWREIRDIDGTQGWVNENLLSGKRNVIIIDNKFMDPSVKRHVQPQEMLLFNEPNEQSDPKVRVEFGVIANLKSCELEWCKIKVESYTGWIRKENIWGVYKEEVM